MFTHIYHIVIKIQNIIAKTSIILLNVYYLTKFFLNTKTVNLSIIQTIYFHSRFLSVSIKVALQPQTKKNAIQKLVI